MAHKKKPHLSHKDKKEKDDYKKDDKKKEMPMKKGRC